MYGAPFLLKFVKRVTAPTELLTELHDEKDQEQGRNEIRLGESTGLRKGAPEKRIQEVGHNEPDRHDQEDVHPLDVPESVPVPPRYRWIKIALALSGAFLVVVVALRVWWGWVADARLEAVLTAYREAGQPLLQEIDAAAGY